MKNLSGNYRYSSEFLNNLESLISNNFESLENRVSIGVLGSFGRLEASKSSDLDYFMLISEENHEIEKYQQNFESSFKLNNPTVKISLIHKCNVSDLLKNIGGSNDTSKLLTIRVLLLLESRCLFNKPLYNQVLKDLHENYLEEYVREQKFPLFFTNEIIRFWRTLCIDYRFKKIEASKPWGLRNIKLRFSRKFDTFLSIYFSILLYKNKISLDKFKEALNNPTLSKINNIHSIINGNVELSNIFNEICTIYDDFIGYINNASNRKNLEELNFENRNQNSTYIMLKEKAQVFQDKMISVLKLEDEAIFNKYLIL